MKSLFSAVTSPPGGERASSEERQTTEREAITPPATRNVFVASEKIRRVSTPGDVDHLHAERNRGVARSGRNSRGRCDRRRRTYKGVLADGLSFCLGKGSRRMVPAEVDEVRLCVG